MKRFLTLLLAAAMVLSFAACGDNGTTIRNENEEDNVKKDPIAAQYLQDLAVKTADYPVLPAMPNESELDEAFSTIDYDKMGADAYEKAQEKIWTDSGRRRRYSSRGVSITMRSRRCAARARATPRHSCTSHRRRARCFRRRRTPFSRPQTCISPLRCSARRRTATAARSFYRF